jgi:hypothetical protein
LALIAALIACDNDIDFTGLDDDSNTLVRVLHASPEAPIMDAVLNFGFIATELHYLDLSDYVGVKPNEHTFQFRKTNRLVPNTDRPLVLTHLTVEPNQRYTILAVDSFSARTIQDNQLFRRHQGVEPLTLLDDPTLAPPGNARLRFVNAAPSTVLVDVYITAPNVDINAVTPTFNALAFKSVVTYTNFPAGTFRVRVTIAGTKTVLLDVNPFVLVDGTVQTAVMLDGPAGGTPSILLRLNDRVVHIVDD